LALFNGSDETATVSVDVGYYLKENAALKGFIGYEGEAATLSLCSAYETL